MEAANIKKGEEWEWLIEDRNEFVFKRKNPQKSLKRMKKIKLS